MLNPCNPCCSPPHPCTTGVACISFVDPYTGADISDIQYETSFAFPPVFKDWINGDCFTQAAGGGSLTIRQVDEFTSCMAGGTFFYDGVVACQKNDIHIPFCPTRILVDFSEWPEGLFPEFDYGSYTFLSGPSGFRPMLQRYVNTVQFDDSLYATGWCYNLPDNAKELQGYDTINVRWSASVSGGECTPEGMTFYEPGCLQAPLQHCQMNHIVVPSPPVVNTCHLYMECARTYQCSDGTDLIGFIPFMCAPPRFTLNDVVNNRTVTLIHDNPCQFLWMSLPEIIPSDNGPFGTPHIDGTCQLQYVLSRDPRTGAWTAGMIIHDCTAGTSPRTTLEIWSGVLSSPCPPPVNQAIVFPSFPFPVLGYITE
jgi:hypothetical protein